MTDVRREGVEKWMWESCPHGHIGTNHCPDCLLAWHDAEVATLTQRLAAVEGQKKIPVIETKDGLDAVKAVFAENWKAAFELLAK